MKHGPYSILELISWHRYGHLQDSSMVRYELGSCKVMFRLHVLQTGLLCLPNAIYGYPFSAEKFLYFHLIITC